MNSNCTGSYMLLTSLTYIPGVSVKISFIRFILNMQIKHILIKDNRIDGVIISMLASSAVDRGFEP